MTESEITTILDRIGAAGAAVTSTAWPMLVRYEWIRGMAQVGVGVVALVVAFVAFCFAQDAYHVAMVRERQQPTWDDSEVTWVLLPSLVAAVAALVSMSLTGIGLLRTLAPEGSALHSLLGR